MNAQVLMEAAYEQAEKSYREGGLPIGSVLADAAGVIVSRGHNLRVQTGDPTAHAEVVCLRNAGRRRDFSTMTLVSTALALHHVHGHESALSDSTRGHR